MGLGTRIADARTDAGLTQAELAEAVGRSVHAVRKWEQDKNEPALDKLEEIASITDASLAFLVGIEQDEEAGESQRAQCLRRRVETVVKQLDENGLPLRPPDRSTPLHPGVEALAEDEYIRETYEVTEEEIDALRTCIIGSPDGSFVIIESLQQALQLLQTIRTLTSGR